MSYCTTAPRRPCSAVSLDIRKAPRDMALRVPTFLLLLLVCAASAASAAAPGILSRETRGSNDQSITIGSRGPYDRLLMSKSVVNSGKMLRVSEEKLEVRVPAGVITQLVIEDMLKNKKNAAATVKKGGPGHSDVTLKFKSQRGGKISYFVSVYGR